VYRVGDEVEYRGGDGNWHPGEIIAVGKDKVKVKCDWGRFWFIVTDSIRPYRTAVPPVDQKVPVDKSSNTPDSGNTKTTATGAEIANQLKRLNESGLAALKAEYDADWYGASMDRLNTPRYQPVNSLGEPDWFFRLQKEKAERRRKKCAAWARRNPRQLGKTHSDMCPKCLSNGTLSTLGFDAGFNDDWCISVSPLFIETCCPKCNYEDTLIDNLDPRQFDEA
jgi:hypothetical protein